MNPYKLAITICIWREKEEVSQNGTQKSAVEKFQLVTGQLVCVCVLQNDDEKGKKKEQHFCVHLCIYDQILTKAINIWREKEEVS